MTANNRKSNLIVLNIFFVHVTKLEGKWTDNVKLKLVSLDFSGLSLMLAVSRSQSGPCSSRNRATVTAGGWRRKQQYLSFQISYQERNVFQKVLCPQPQQIFHFGLVGQDQVTELLGGEAG